MVAEHLTLRNLTATPVVLKELERFSPPEEPKPDITDFKNITNSFKTLMSNVTNVTRSEPEVRSIDPGAQQAFGKQDLSINVEPFSTLDTDIRAFDKSDKEQLKLVFEAEGERHEVQVPVPTSESATMKPLVENPRFRFTGVYIRPHSHLAIFSSANLHAWMRELRDDILTSALSIPGTHNSPTCHVAPPSVRCQAVSPREQLDNGVRFFDIRVQPQFPEQPEKDELILVHSAFPISLTGNKYFRDLVNEVEDFLQRNPSETLIMSVKREGPGEHTDEQLSRILRDHYARDGSRWYTEPKIPTLGEARGKIVLIRRFGLEPRLNGEWNGRGWGIDAGGWADNTPNATCPSGHLCVQDFYEVLETENIDTKVEYVNAHIGRAAEVNYPFGVITAEGDQGKLPFFINFLSASNFWKLQTWPEKIAARINPSTVDYLCRSHKAENGDWSTGVLVCDWVGLDGDWDLVRCVVGMNTKLTVKQG